MWQTVVSDGTVRQSFCPGSESCVDDSDPTKLAQGWITTQGCKSQPLLADLNCLQNAFFIKNIVGNNYWYAFPSLEIDLYLWWRATFRLFWTMAPVNGLSNYYSMLVLLTCSTHQASTLRRASYWRLREIQTTKNLRKHWKVWSGLPQCKLVTHKILSLLHESKQQLCYFIDTILFLYCCSKIHREEPFPHHPAKAKCS